MSAICISDLHLDPSSDAVFARLCALLAEESQRVDAIYVLGDLVEMWVGDDDDDPFAEALRDALRRCSAITELYLMHGNRDFLFGERFASDIGAILIEDPTPIEVADNRVLLAHGDAFCTRDEPYQQMRALFRSPQWQSDILSRGLEERRELARGLRAQSIAANGNKAQNIMDVTEDVVARTMNEYACDAVIHGHTHRPGIHRIDDVRRRYVLGDWNACGWLARLDDEITLECFPI